MALTEKDQDAAARLERLRADPEVVISHRTSTEPYTPVISVTSPISPLWLLDRIDSEYEAESKPSSAP